MLQLKVVDQTHYVLYADREYLIDVHFDGKADLYVCDGVNEGYNHSFKHYTYLHTYCSLDSLLHCLHERGER